MRKLLVALLCFLQATVAVGVDINGQLKKAQLEKLSGDPTPTEARLYYNTTLDQMKIYDGASWRIIVDTTTALSNPMDSAGDMIYGGVGGAATKLDNGTSTQVLRGGTTPSWGAVTESHVDSTVIVASGAQAKSGVLTLNDGAKLDDAAGQTTLNYFDEDTFTPVVEGSTTSGSCTYTAQQGRFTRLGSTVLFSIFIGWHSCTGTGDVQIADLPFTPGFSTSFAVYSHTVNTPAGATAVVIGRTDAPTTKIMLYSPRDNDSPLAITQADNSGATERTLIINGWFRL